MMQRLSVYFRKAGYYLKNSQRLSMLLNQAVHKFRNSPDIKKDIVTSFTTYKRMMQAYIRQEYTRVPWKSMLMVTAAMLYFVNPFDVVPDFIPASGLVDDVTVMLFVYRYIKDDILAFREWEQGVEAKEL